MPSLTAATRALALLTCTALVLLASPAAAVTKKLYFLAFFPTDGAYFTELSGAMVVPKLPRAAYYYLWPGLQPTDETGVYQNVLDGRSGGWWFGSGWCCDNPRLPWGAGFNTREGDVNTFSNVRLNATDWQTTIVHGGEGAVPLVTRFPLANKTFDQVYFSIELYEGAAWDFGPLTFENITMVVEGSADTKWCTTTPSNHDFATLFTIIGTEAVVEGTKVTCTIASLTMDAPGDVQSQAVK